MNQIAKITGMKDRTIILSTLWVFMLFNYLYWDLAPMIFGLATKQVATGMSDGMLLGFALFIESAIAMILLSRVLAYRANRWANIIVGAIHAAVISWAMWGGAGRAVDTFFAGIVIVSAVFIAGYAWVWPNPESQPTA